MFLYSVPGIIGGLWIYYLPESPKYLLSVNRNQEALDVVKWIFNTNKGSRKNKMNFEIVKLKSEMQGTGNELKGL